MTEVRKGDYVRITIEGEWLVEGYTVEGIKALPEIGVAPGDTVTVEKIEPPVETFKPGDVVRPKANHEYVYAILENDKYTYLKCPEEFTILGGTFGPMYPPFTSRHYEKVSIE